jgi:putative transposase
MIEPNLSQISMRRQCELIGLSRSTFYYSPATETELNLQKMRLIDEQYTKSPFYGWPRMTVHLFQSWRQGWIVTSGSIMKNTHTRA